MPKCNTSDTIFEEIDTNKDGTIDKREFRRWLKNNEAVPCTTYETSTSEIYFNDKNISRYDRSRYVTDETFGLSNAVVNSKVIQTHSLEETNEYLEKAVNIYKDPNPQIIRRAATESQLRYEQRILLRYLQPPPVPAPGPLIIKEVRPSQPPPPSPLVIRQYAQAVAAPPPLILRERPPTPPPYIPSETIVRQLPALPAPPRSVIIERFASAPEKPRDIIIERWLPYGPQPERPTIVEEAGEVVAYPEPRNKIIIYEGAQAHVVRQFEKLGVVQADPETYLARYGVTLLDPQILVQRAREAGVYEDLSVPAKSYLTSRYTEYTGDTYARRRGTYFDYIYYGLFPADYTRGMRITRKFVRPANFIFPPSTMWSTRIGKCKEHVVDGHAASVTFELIENGVVVYTRTITEEEYQNAHVYSSAPKLSWKDFLHVLQVFMLGNDQERESDINEAFDILDQGRRGLYGRTVSLPDGRISPDELRAFLSILTDEYRIDLCVYLADTDGSGQICLPEFIRMVKSGLARDVICECI